MTEKPYKSTKAVIEKRVAEVSNLLLSGHTKSQIVRYGSSWQVSDRQIDDYIAQATKAIKEVNQLTLQENQGIVLSNLWKLFLKAEGDGSLSCISEQHKILMSIAKLKGLDQMTVNHVIEDKRELSDISDEDLDALIIDTPCLQPGS